MATNIRVINNANSTNSTLNSTVRQYIFTPAGFHVKMTLGSFALLFGGISLIANALILHFKRSQRKGRIKNKAFSRLLTSYFMKNLALSDFLCSLISLPLMVMQLFVDAFQNDWGCRVARYFNILFPVVTMFNFIIIGIERYLATYHPFNVPTKKTVSKLIAGAWISGALITLLPIATFKAIRYDIGANAYTLICKYDSNIPVYRAMFLTFNMVVYVIPSLVLICTSIRILIYLRRSRTVVHNTVTNLRANSWRFQGTLMFVALIFAFILPYFLYMTYSGINMAVRPNISFNVDYVVRYTSGLIAYSGGAVRPVIFFYKMDDMRRMLREFLTKLFHLKQNPIASNTVAVNSHNHSETEIETLQSNWADSFKYPPSPRPRSPQDHSGAVLNVSSLTPRGSEIKIDNSLANPRADFFMYSTSPCPSSPWDHAGAVLNVSSLAHRGSEIESDNSLGNSWAELFRRHSTSPRPRSPRNHAGTVPNVSS